MQFMSLLYSENNMLISVLFMVSGMGKLRGSGGERSPGSCTKKFELAYCRSAICILNC
jgi:hypothetical protein